MSVSDLSGDRQTDHLNFRGDTRTWGSSTGDTGDTSRWGLRSSVVPSRVVHFLSFSVHVATGGVVGESSLGCSNCSRD